MGLIVDFIKISVGLVGLINVVEGVFTEEKDKTRRDFWIDPEIRRTVVSSSIGLSYLFLFYLGPPRHPSHLQHLLFLPEHDGIAGLQVRLAQNDDGMAGSGFL